MSEEYNIWKISQSGRQWGYICTVGAYADLLYSVGIRDIRSLLSAERSELSD